MTTEEDRDSDAKPRCVECETELDFTDGKAVSVEINRSELYEDQGREFRETQVYEFCGLAHANSWLSKHPIPDEWRDSNLELGEDLGVLEKIGCTLIALTFLAVLLTGTIVGVQWVWKLVA